MELKFYLRGLGLGIVVTALIMGIAGSKNQTMSDAEIIARAKQLGMIEDTVLKEKTSGEENNSKETASGNVDNLQEETPESDPDIQPKEEKNTEPGSDTDREAAEPDANMDTEDIETNKDEEGMGAPDADTGAEDMESDTGAEGIGSETERNAPGTPVVITIGNGDGSYSASKKLAEAGVVSSAESFDNFLCENGYDKKIRAGTYTIPANASDEQMARIITGAE